MALCSKCFSESEWRSRYNCAAKIFTDNAVDHLHREKDLRDGETDNQLTKEQVSKQ